MRCDRDAHHASARSALRSAMQARDNSYLELLKPHVLGIRCSRPRRSAPHRWEREQTIARTREGELCPLRRHAAWERVADDQPRGEGEGRHRVAHTHTVVLELRSDAQPAPGGDRGAHSRSVNTRAASSSATHARSSMVTPSRRRAARNSQGGTGAVRAEAASRCERGHRRARACSPFPRRAKIERARARGDCGAASSRAAPRRGLRIRQAEAHAERLARGCSADVGARWSWAGGAVLGPGQRARAATARIACVT